MAKAPKIKRQEPALSACVVFCVFRKSLSYWNHAPLYIRGGREGALTDCTGICTVHGWRLYIHSPFRSLPSGRRTAICTGTQITQIRRYFLCTTTDTYCRYKVHTAPETAAVCPGTVRETAEHISDVACQHVLGTEELF